MEIDPTSEDLRVALGSALADYDRIQEGLHHDDDLANADRQVILERRVEALEGLVSALVQCTTRLMKRTN
jgi:hypothetical protein